MEPNPSGDENIVPPIADEILKNPYHRRNIVIHIDRDDGGGEIIPYQGDISMNEILEIHDNYFLHNDLDNWRRSVFHYGLYVDTCTPKGFGFSGDTKPYWGYIPGTNSFAV